MLVITRKHDEAIVIRAGGALIRVMIVRVKGQKVRLGVTATDTVTGAVLSRAEVLVDREELYREGY